MSATNLRGRRSGFSLIELMIALLLCLFLMGAVVAVATSSSRVAKVARGAARLQENARFAMSLIADDIRNAGVQYCFNFTGSGIVSNGNEFRLHEPMRGSLAWFDASQAPWYLGQGPVAAPYWVDPSEAIRGFECGIGGSCLPGESVFAPAAALPTTGMDDGDRARGTDVLILRSLHGNGVPLAGVTDETVNGTPAQLLLGGSVAELGLAAGAAVYAADCSTAVLARVALVSDNQLQLSGNFDDDTFPTFDTQHQARVFNASRDLDTVAYFVQVQTMQTEQGTPRKVSSLMRRVNGTDVVLADGIERLDFLYHVELADGRTVVLAADQVDSLGACRSWGTITQSFAAASPSCGWRSIQGIEVHLLASSVEAVPEGDGSYRYRWRASGANNATASFESTSTGLATGLPAGRELRQEFSTYVAVRGYNL